MSGQYVGIDLHRRRSVIVHKNEAGDVVAVRKVANDPVKLASAVMDAGEHPEVILEATYGWYWAADLLSELGCDVHLAAPPSLNWGQRRVKNDERDAIDLIDLYRLGRMTEAWIAPPRTRELRELVRYRLKLTGLRTGLKAQLHAVNCSATLYKSTTPNAPFVDEVRCPRGHSVCPRCLKLVGGELRVAHAFTTSRYSL
jgi:transposase